jgi:hypothetical protein
MIDIICFEFKKYNYLLDDRLDEISNYENSSDSR